MRVYSRYIMTSIAMDDDSALDGAAFDELIEDVLTDPSIVGVGCWGGMLANSFQNCTSGFVPGENHFKSKFCAHCCSHGFDVDSARVCGLDPALRDKFANRQGRSVWTDNHRLANQTLKCHGPRLLIFRGRIPADLEGTVPLPTEWLRHHSATTTAASGTGTGTGTGHGGSGVAPSKTYIRFAVKLGTVCPIADPCFLGRSSVSRATTSSDGARGGFSSTGGVTTEMLVTKRPREHPDAAAEPDHGTAGHEQST